jgi:hypothetical protein
MFAFMPLWGFSIYEYTAYHDALEGSDKPAT